MHSDSGSAKAKSYGPAVPVPAPQHCVIPKILNDKYVTGLYSVVDPDPHVFGPPGSGSRSTSQKYGSFCHHAKTVRKTLIPTIL
jgi:hypothetical protein